MDTQKKLDHTLFTMVLLAISAVVLFCAVNSRWEYSSYILMRLGITYVAIQLAVWYRQLCVPLIILALLYQPILRLPLNRTLWGTINSVTALAAVIGFVVLLSHRNAGAKETPKDE